MYMDENSPSGMWKWLIGLLVVCNIALIAIIWLRPQPQGQYNMPPRPGHDSKRAMNFDSQLNLTKVQQTDFDRLVAEQHKAIDSLKSLAKNSREQFFSNVNIASLDSMHMARLSNELGNYHRLIELQTFASFRQIRAILTDEQKTTYDRIIKDVLTRMPEQPHFKGDGQAPPPGRDGRDDDEHHHRTDNDGPPHNQ